MILQRLLMIIFYLQLHHKATIDELSANLEISRRTVSRDIELLRTSGVDIESCAGKNGGYRLAPDFSFEKIIFSRNELSSMLLSAKLLGQFKETEFAKEAAALHDKIAKLLKREPKSSSAKVSEFLLVDTTPEVYPNNLQEILSCVERAYDNHQLLFIRYHSMLCQKLSTSNLVAPYGLVNKAGYWYIVGYCYELQTYRTFNTAFIEQIHPTTTSYVRDSNFNLDEFWETQQSS